jgi:hypothetical protein
LKVTKVLQFGEGNFLRTFVDHYFDTLNEEGGDFSVHIVKPIPFGSLENFKKQNNRYHIVLRGMDGAEAVEKVREIKKISQDPVSLETPIGEEEDSHLGDFIPDEDIPSPVDAAAYSMLQKQLREVLDTLSER